jgi:hypothetical protein
LAQEFNPAAFYCFRLLLLLVNWTRITPLITAIMPVI